MDIVAAVSSAEKSWIAYVEVKVISDSKQLQYVGKSRCVYRVVQYRLDIRRSVIPPSEVRVVQLEYLLLLLVSSELS